MRQAYRPEKRNAHGLRRTGKAMLAPALEREAPAVLWEGLSDAEAAHTVQEKDRRHPRCLPAAPACFRSAVGGDRPSSRRRSPHHKALEVQGSYQERTNPRRYRDDGPNNETPVLRRENKQPDPYTKIVSFRPYQDGLGVQRDTRTARPQAYVLGEAWFAYNLARNLAARQ